MLLYIWNNIRIEVIDSKLRNLFEATTKQKNKTCTQRHITEFSNEIVSFILPYLLLRWFLLTIKFYKKKNKKESKKEFALMLGC